MTITDYLSILFSRQRWRYVLLAAVILHLLAGTYALFRDVTLGLNLSLLINTVQFALVQLALMLLYSSTNKQEDQRYSLNACFYLKYYHKERHRWLALQKDPRSGVRALTKLDSPNLLPKELKRLESRLDLMISHSILEWTPTRLMKIDEINFELTDEWYDLPWFVAESGLETILKRFNAIDKYDYNGLTLATYCWVDNKEGMTICFKKSCYYNYLATNMLPEMRFHRGLSYRDLLEPGPSLSSLETALTENHLGLSCLIRTRDGALIIPRRSKNTTVFKGQLSPSISGAANLSTCRDKDGGYSAVAWLAQELKEELPFLTVGSENNPGLRLSDLKQANFLGMTRELRRCGKPELFFFLQLDIDTARVNQLWHQSRFSQKYDITRNDTQYIDYNENADLLLINEHDLFEKIQPYLVDAQGLLNKKQSELHVTLPRNEQRYILSESLLVNLILYRLKQQNETV